MSDQSESAISYVLASIADIALTSKLYLLAFKSMHSPKLPTLKIGTDIASAKTVFLRVPPELHAALVVAAGAEQQKRGERVSVNWLASRVLAEAMGFDVSE